MQMHRERLLTISLRLDEYVYNHKPIPVAEAQMYLDEIATYKPQCGQDEHSLQVIEKLTRCMTTIIHQESYSFDFTNTSDGGTHNTYCPSPVYSIADEDRTQYNEDQMTNEENFNTNALQRNGDEIDTIDLTNDEENNNNPRETVISADASTSLNRSMSNLSIRDVENDPLHVTSDDYSQSILDNSKHQYTNNGFENTGNTPLLIRDGKDPLQVTTTVCKQSITEKGKPNTTDNMAHVQKSPILNYHIIVKPSVLKEISKNDSEKIKRLHDVRINKKKAEHFSTDMNTESLDMLVPTNKINDQSLTIKRKIKAAQNKCCTKNETTDHHQTIEQDKKTRRNKNTGKTQNKDNKVNKQRRKCNTRKNKTQITPTSKLVEVNTTTVTKETDFETVLPVYRINSDLTKATETILDDNVKSVTTYTHVLQTSILRSNEPTSIYNTNTENDLSWLENIRFVREINSDEYDPTLTNTGNDFWDNYTLPNGWNDKDFQY